MVQPLSHTEAASAVDTLAAVFRTMPAFPVIGDPAQATALYRDYDGWSRHLLTGTPPPGLGEGGQQLSRPGWLLIDTIIFRD